MNQKMDAILFSANPTLVNVYDAIRHLLHHNELYWEIGFRINPERFHYPLLGFIHICGKKVEFVATIKDIIPYTRSQYEDKKLSIKVKPSEWMKDWEENRNNICNYGWKYTLIMTHIESFSYNTYLFKKYDGKKVTKAPQNYILYYSVIIILFYQ